MSRQTDRQSDRFAITISHSVNISMLIRDKKREWNYYVCVIG